MTELKACLYRENGDGPVLSNYIVGLGGKNVSAADLLQAARESIAAAESCKLPDKPKWIGYGI